MTPLLNPTITIIDVDASIPLAEIEKAAAALQRQVREHLAPAWGYGSGVTVRAATSGGYIQPSEWRLDLVKVMTVQGALGYHDVGHLFVDPALCAEDGDSWTSCASHEILEALADPLLRRCVQGPDNAIWALEICDAVEAQTYKVDGIDVSNFVLPAYFEPPPDRAAYDWLGKIVSPLQVLAGGYGQTYTPGAGWSQVGQMRRYRARLAELGLGRGARRNRRHAR